MAVIFDEYDAPLLDKLHQEALLDDFRNVMQEFYVQLKANEAMIRFCFITGITKFSQLSILSTINNLTNISLQREYSALLSYLRPVYGNRKKKVARRLLFQDNRKKNIHVSYDKFRNFCILL